MGRFALWASILWTLALGAVPARADTPPDHVTEVDPLDIPPEHDPLAHAFERYDERGGFYLRTSINLGYAVTRLGQPPSQGDNAKVHGFGTAFGVDIGGFVQPWLALHLDATAGLLWNGSIDWPFGIAATSNSARIGAYGAAPAATFFLPHWFFIKTAFGVGFANVKNAGRSDTTKPGFYMDLVLGKDLYVDDHLSFGIQMQIIYMLLKNDASSSFARGTLQGFDEARVQQYLWGFSLGFDSL